MPDDAPTSTTILCSHCRRTVRAVRPYKSTWPGAHTCPHGLRCEGSGSPRSERCDDCAAARERPADDVRLVAQLGPTYVPPGDLSNLPIHLRARGRPQEIIVRAAHYASHARPTEKLGTVVS